MNTVTFIILYCIILSVAIIIEIYILHNDKRRYIRRSYIGLLSILSKRDEYKYEDFVNEIERFYDRYYQARPAIKKSFPNVIIWLDEIIFRIDIGIGHSGKLEEYNMMLKDVRNTLGLRYPFCKCEEYQQSILQDISKIRNKDNEALIDNIINRTEEEFLKLSSDIKKNQFQNAISIMIGIIGIIVSVLMAFMKI